jgi:hypothetical protein
MQMYDGGALKSSASAEASADAMRSWNGAMTDKERVRGRPRVAIHE